METKTLVTITILVLLVSMMIGIPAFVMTGHNNAAQSLGAVGTIVMFVLLAGHSEL